MLSRPISILTAAVTLVLGAPLTAQDKSPDDQASRMPYLPPAQFDENLAIGGEEIEARKLRSRLTVEVEVNGAGPDSASASCSPVMEVGVTAVAFDRDGVRNIRYACEQEKVSTAMKWMLSAVTRER